MNTARKTIRKSTLIQLARDDHKGTISSTIKSLKEKLIDYSESSYDENTWLIRTEGSRDKSLSFHFFTKFGDKVTELMKIYILIKLSQNHAPDNSSTTSIHPFFIFLLHDNLLLHQLTKETIIYFIEYLKEKDISEKVKKHYLTVVLQFLHFMQGHPNMPILPGVALIKIPFKDDGLGGWKVIDTQILSTLDKHFQNATTPIHYRLAYWIMRLYATRPDETFEFPLHCVEKMTNNIAIMRAYVAKQSNVVVDRNKEKYHQLHYLDLNNIHMNYLYKLILTQQEIAGQLQKKIKKKGYLFTYQPAAHNGAIHKARVTSSQRYAQYIKNIQREMGIPESKRARPRDFKKTGITNRAEWGFRSFELKQVANHKEFETLNSYSVPSEAFMIKKQKEVLESDGKISSRYVFRGKVVNGIDDATERKILAHPRAHKLPQMGYCPDVNHCGNHFACIGCDDLLPDKELTDYYYEQAMRYIKIAAKQKGIGQVVNAKDSLHRATMFNNLYMRVRSSDA